MAPDTHHGRVIDLSDPVFSLIGSVAEAEGLTACAVGGYVRDLLLGRPCVDIDIVVVGDGIAFARKVAKALGEAEPVVYETFGTAMLPFRSGKLEFVGARKESYAPDSRKPAVARGSLAEDLARRDFTVNALAVPLSGPEKGVLIDPYDGRADLSRKVLRTPLEPKETFDDDPLRMMRAARFASQLGFEVAPHVLSAIQSMHHRIEIVSKERIADEFLKIMRTPRPSVGLGLLYSTGLLDAILPEASAMAGVEQRQEYHHKDVFWHTLKVVDNVAAQSDRLWLRVAALFHDIAKPRTKAFKEGIGWTFHGHEEVGARMIKGIFRRMKLPLSDVAYVEKLVRLHLRPMALVDSEVTDAAVRRLMFDAGETIDDLMVLCRADITSKNIRKVDRIHQNYDLVMQKMEEVEEKDKIRSWRPPIDGSEIMEACGLPAGPVIGALKDAVIDAILDGRIENSKQAALKHLADVKGPIIEEYERTGRAPKIPRETLFSGKTLPPTTS